MTGIGTYLKESLAMRHLILPAETGRCMNTSALACRDALAGFRWQKFSASTPHPSYLLQHVTPAFTDQAGMEKTRLSSKSKRLASVYAQPMTSVVVLHVAWCGAEAGRSRAVPRLLQESRMRN